MINLLPFEEKEKLFLEYKKKLIIILGSTILIPLVCLILILLSIRFHILGEVKTHKVILEQAKNKYQTADILIFTDIIKNNNKILTQLESFYKKEIYLTKVLEIISDTPRPNNLYLTALSLSRNESQKIKVVVSGFSEYRDDLLLFKKNIEENKVIKTPYFSPESWVDAKNVKFYLTFEISQ